MNAADLHISDAIQPSRRTADYVGRAARAVLAELRPRKEQLEHGLALHRDSVVCDTMGGVDTGGPGRLYGLYSERMDEYAREQLARSESTDRVSGDTIRKTLADWRPSELISDPVTQADHRYLWDATGVTLGVSTADHWTQELIAARDRACEQLDHLENVLTLDDLTQVKGAGKHAVIRH